MTARHLTLFLVMSIFVSCCAGAQAMPTATASGETPVNVVVGVQGGVSIKRQGWSDYAPALFGMTVRADDLLRVDNAAQATLACSDLTLAKAAAGVSAAPCKVSKPLLYSGGRLVMPTRADPPLDIPMILSPRKTRVLTARPTLRWSAVAGATTYKVSVRGPNLTWSSDVSGKPDIVYPDNAPALVAGVTYKLSVSAGTRSSDEETTAGLGFTVIKADEQKAVRDGEARIRNLGLPDAATRLLIANLYASQGATGEAIDQLEGLAATTSEPAVVRTLGDLYLKVGLNRLAEQRYTSALALSQTVNDIEGQAAAQNALSLVYEALGSITEAQQRGQKSIEWYQKVGDSRTVKQIQDRLSALPRP